MQDHLAPDIRGAARSLTRALAALLDASFEPPETRVVTLAAAQECCRQADAAIESLRVNAEEEAGE